ncbi:unnamed protein product [Allacma fusca]|uniref:Uncharacterized protein n=1 Tax=Allacma fusca TaxID=39272 RepID=A0A8J2KQP8_9HEXA|nr:unnamed protein product [Allacma fusca]
MIPPHLIKTSSGFDGGNFQVLLAVTKKLNYSFEIDASNIGTGSYRNGTWTGMTGSVYYKKADLCILNSASLERHDILDFVYIASDHIEFGTRLPSIYIKWQTVVYPFTTELWGLLGCCFVGTAILLHLELHLRSEFNNYYCTNSGLLITYKIMMDQSSELKGFSEKFKIFLGLWMLCYLVIGSAYKSDLVSFFSTQAEEEVPEDFDQLDLHQEYSIVFNYLGGTSYNYFNKSRDGVATHILPRVISFERDPGKCILEAVLNSKTVCISFHTPLKTVIARNVSLPGIAESIVLISRPIRSFSTGFAFQKKSVLTDDFAGLVGRLRDAGMPGKWRENIYAYFMHRGKLWIKSKNSKLLYQTLVRIWEERKRPKLHKE